MLVNFGKCKCLHLGHWNLDANNKMGFTVLGTTVREKKYTINADMTVSYQCGIAVSSCNQIIGLIRRIINYQKKLTNYTSLKKQLVGLIKNTVYKLG